MSSSTSMAVMPGPSVWISTLGGANSGNTSTGIFCSCWVPKTNSIAAMASTRKRNLRLEPMIQVNIDHSIPWALGMVSSHFLFVGADSGPLAMHLVFNP